MHGASDKRDIMRKLFGMVVALSLTAAGCGGAATDTSAAPETNSESVQAAGLQETRFVTPRYVVEQNLEGAKTLFPIRNQVIDRKNPISTKPTGWQSGNSPAASVTCNSFSVTQVSTGARVCGMKCTDNTYYKMDCNADIFASGFDIIATE
jgi:hypothetical protein